MSDSIDRKVREIIADQLGIGEDDVTPDAMLAEELGADSLDLVELVMAIEEEFDLDIAEEVVDQFQTVADIVTYVEQMTKS